MPARRLLTALLVASLAPAACSRGVHGTVAPGPRRGGPAGPAAVGSGQLPGMPPLLDPRDVYAADRPGQLSPLARSFPERVYVPNSVSDSLDVIDPATLKIIDHFAVGRLPQHVVPSYDLKTLWVTNDLSNTLTPIDPATGKPGAPVAVDDPYNLYFTPDGSNAIVVAERLRRLEFRDPQTMAVHKSLPVPCNGVDHMDFSADGTFSSPAASSAHD